jgi:hypothetical protein
VGHLVVLVGRAVRLLAVVVAEEARLHQGEKAILEEEVVLVARVAHSVYLYGD